VFSIDNIRERIRDIRRDAEAGNATGAVTALEELISDILRTDLPLFVMKRGQGFYTASAGEGDPRMFARVFTHESLASDYLPNIKNGAIEEISVVESLQLSKFLFLRGAYGLVINDGDEWAAISFSDYIDIFFKRILQQECCVSQSYINCVRLVTAVQKNSLYQLAYLSCGGQPEIVIDGQLSCCIIDCESESPVQVDTVPVPLTIQDLFKFRHRIIVRSRYLAFTLEDYAELYKILEFYGVVQQETERAAGFYDEPICWMEGDGDYHTIQDISLCFDTGSACQEAVTGQCTALVPVAEKGKYSEGKGNNNKENDTKDIGRKCSRIAGLLAGKSGRRTWKSLYKGNPRDGILKGPLKAKSFFGLCTGIIIVFMLLGVSGRLLSDMADRRAYTQFEKALYNSDYTQAYRLYAENGRQEYSDLIEKKIDSLVSQYAHNRIDTAELKSALKALGHFPGQTSSLENASAAAARLEVSKEAFKNGLESEDVPVKLSHWIKVIPLDEEHYAAVQAEVSQNNEKWSAILLKAIEKYAYADKETSVDYVSIGVAMFPQREEFREWEDRFSDELARPPLSDYPIYIEKIDVCEGANNAVAIFIKWRNDSTKAFQSVDFYFTFFDADGGRITYRRRGEENIVFQGIDSKAAPYEPGFETSSDTWGWNRVWPGCGNEVEKVKLTCVKVHYMDGSTDVFSSQQDLDLILSGGLQ